MESKKVYIICRKSGDGYIDPIIAYTSKELAEAKCKKKNDESPYGEDYCVEDCPILKPNKAETRKLINHYSKKEVER